MSALSYQPSHHAGMISLAESVDYLHFPLENGVEKTNSPGRPG